MFSSGAAVLVGACLTGEDDKRSAAGAEDLFQTITRPIISTRLMMLAMMAAFFHFPSRSGGGASVARVLSLAAELFAPRTMRSRSALRRRIFRSAARALFSAASAFFRSAVSLRAASSSLLFVSRSRFCMCWPNNCFRSTSSDCREIFSCILRSNPAACGLSRSEKNSSMWRMFFFKPSSADFQYESSRRSRQVTSPMLRLAHMALLCIKS